MRKRKRTLLLALVLSVAAQLTASVSFAAKPTSAAPVRHTLHFCVPMHGTHCFTWHWRSRAPKPTHKAPQPSGRWIWVFATGYDDVGIDANGPHSGYGLCAAHPWVFAYGTRFYAPGYGPCQIEDTGTGPRTASGALIEPWIDFWWPDYWSCLRWTGWHRIFIYP